MEINEFANIIKAQATDAPVKPAVGMGGTHQVGTIRFCRVNAVLIGTHRSNA
jgi:hypothetical protein